MEKYMTEFSRIVMLLGLGYTINETAKAVGLSNNQTRYRLTLIRGLVKEHGPERVFYQFVKLFLQSEGLRYILSGQDFDQLATV